jgi:hypothetical protein
MATGAEYHEMVTSIISAGKARDLLNACRLITRRPQETLGADAIRQRILRFRGKTKSSMDANIVKLDGNGRRPPRNMLSMSRAEECAGYAISQLRRIDKGDPGRMAAFREVLSWLGKNL